MAARLTTADREMFARLGISTELVAAAGIERVTDQEARAQYGITRPGDMSGLVFPYFLPKGNGHVTCRLRRDHPEIEDGKPRNKYVCPFGDARHLYFPPGAAELLEDPATAIGFVESEKACLAMLDWSKRVGRKLLPIATGGCYGWRGRIGKLLDASGSRVDEVGPLPDLECVAGRKVYILFDANAAVNAKVQAARRAFATELRRRMAEVIIVDLPAAPGINGPDDYLAVAGDEKLAELFQKANEEDEEQPPGRQLTTESSNAERLVQRYLGDIHYCSDREVWCSWDGRVWQVNDVGAVLERMRDVARSIYFEAAAEPEKHLRESLWSWAKSSEARARLENSIAIARWFPGVEVREFGKKFDTDPMLLNFKNGTLDLRTGELKPHNRADYLTKIIPIDYSPRAECLRFKGFLNEILPAPGLVAYMCRILGYALTAKTWGQCWWVFCGGTATGKSTLLAILRGALGPYALALPENYFLATRSTSDFVTATLPGVRLATCVETAEGRRLDVSKLNMLTGQDTINAALKYQNNFEFRMQAKLILATNHPPRVPAGDDAVWRRLKVVPFETFIPERKRIEDLAEQVIAQEHAGILRLAVLGCQSWQDGGFVEEPQAVKSAIATYRRAQDVVQDFLDERSTREANARVPRKDLFFELRSYLTDNGLPPMTGKKVAQELKRLGIAGDDGDRYWLGIRLVRT